VQATRLSVNDGLAEILLDRPDVFNAIDLETARELTQRLLTLSVDRSIRGIVISGAGKAFSAGGDIKGAMAHPHGPAAAFHELATQVHVCVVEMRRMNKPMIAAINGVAAGGGFSLALACDFRVLARTATLRQAFTSNGLCIDAGGTFILPRLVGLARALEIAAFDEPITAEQALAWGLVNRVVEPGQELAEAHAMARELAKRSLHSFGWSKRLLTNAFETSLESHLEKEREGLVSCAGHPDGSEGMRAFLEKRKPRYD
jgi:2-(1,2-epoxy-1,2-dihydrophenyl)acetyl-CoA isomerase